MKTIAKQFQKMTSSTRKLFLIAGIIISVIIFASCSKDPAPSPTAQLTVYAAGSESNGTKDVAKIWKNGTPTSLTNGTQNAYVYALYVSGSDVYAGGQEFNGTTAKDVAKIWKNVHPPV